MTRGHSVEDGWTARHETLEARDPTSGVDEYVGGGDQVGHPVGEPKYANARLRTEGQEQALARLVVSTCHAHHGGRPRSERGADGPVEITYPPPPAGDDGHGADGGEVEGAPGLRPRARLEESGRHERTHAARAASPGQLRDPLTRAVVHHEVEIDPGVGPELEAREVEHRGADGDPYEPVAP